MCTKKNICIYIYIYKSSLLHNIGVNLVIVQLCANKCKKLSSVDEHADHLFNCHLFTAEVKDHHDAIVHEVHSLSHAAKSFSFPKYGDLRTPTGDDGRTPDGLIRGKYKTSLS